MQAYVLEQVGDLGALTLVDRPAPSAGPGQVVVRLRAASLNYRDLMFIEGRYPPGLKMKLPIVPGSDGAGEVVEVGPGVERLRPGDRVVGAFFQNWLDGPFDPPKADALSGTRDGVLAERFVLDEAGAVKLPDGLSFEEAATLPCAGVTAWVALVELGRLRPGEVVLAQGTGGVSVFALQFAKALGARVLLTSSSDDKLARPGARG